MSKSIKIALNYGIGICVSAILLWLLWRQSHGRLVSLKGINWWRADRRIFAIIALLLLPVNMLLESKKWQWLVKSTAPLTLMQSLGSVLTGIAFSMITPNRIGEYPGRMLALNKDFSARMVSVSVLGAVAQLLAVLMGGFAGGLYYCIHAQSSWWWGAWVVNLVGIGLGLAFYFSFDKWSGWIENIRWLKRIHRYGTMLQAFERDMQWKVLAISVLRFGVFTFQYYLALRWMGIALPLLVGMPMCALFFWIMAVVPSISLAEAGIRAEVSWQLFHQYGADAAVILAATMGLWLVNLLIPAAIGALMMLRVRLLR